LQVHEFDPLIDSSSASPEFWEDMASEIERNYLDYDGFVIIHGTDTMVGGVGVTELKGT
jgi:L-asparaginase